LAINPEQINNQIVTATQQTKSVKWNDNKREDFVNLVHNELTSILGELENIQLNNECSQQDINNIMNKNFGSV
jgi:signal recognition particle GTPase